LCSVKIFDPNNRGSFGTLGFDLLERLDEEIVPPIEILVSCFGSDCCLTDCWFPITFYVYLLSFHSQFIFYFLETIDSTRIFFSNFVVYILCDLFSTTTLFCHHFFRFPITFSIFFSFFSLFRNFSRGETIFSSFLKFLFLKLFHFIPLCRNIFQLLSSIILDHSSYSCIFLLN
jgi:hypothetical protein